MVVPPFVCYQCIIFVVNSQHYLDTIVNAWTCYTSRQRGDLMLPVGDKLRTLRNERNLSQDRLAKKVSVTRASIATYESGNRLPSLYVLVRLARALGVTTDYLLGVSSDKTSFLDVSGLTPKQIESLDLIIENYRECNGGSGENGET